jgi:hypothetical protein
VELRERRCRPRCPEGFLYTSRRGVHEIPPRGFMKPFVDGGGGSLIRSPPPDWVGMSVRNPHRKRPNRRPSGRRFVVGASTAHVCGRAEAMRASSRLQETGASPAVSSIGSGSAGVHCDHVPSRRLARVFGGAASSASLARKLLTRSMLYAAIVKLLSTHPGRVRPGVAPPTGTPTRTAGGSPMGPGHPGRQDAAATLIGSA